MRFTAVCLRKHHRSCWFLPLFGGGKREDGVFCGFNYFTES